MSARRAPVDLYAEINDLKHSRDRWKKEAERLAKELVGVGTERAILKAKLEMADKFIDALKALSVVTKKGDGT